jgi:hypothetical protein
MLATAIIGSTVGVKKARRRSERPGRRPFTHTAISSASAIESGIVPAANHRLLPSTCQNTGSSTMAR